MAKIVIKTNEQRKPTKFYNRAKILFNYVRDKNKCNSTLSLNFLIDDTLKDQIQETALLCENADPSGEKSMIQHFVISGLLESPNETITDEQLYDSAKEFLKRLGYEKCPAYMGIHRNTDRPHVHIIVARVDPETGNAVKIPLIAMAGQKTIAVMSKKYGFNLHARSRYAVENEQLVKLDPPPREIPQELTEKLKTFCDQHRNDFKNWKWGHLHAALAEIGIAMEYRQPKGLFYSLDSEHWTQASFISPELLFSSLEKTLNAESYRKARKSVLERLEQVRNKVKNQKSEIDSQEQPTKAEIIPEKPLKFKDRLKIIENTAPIVYDKIKEIMEHPLFNENKATFYQCTKGLVYSISNSVLNNNTKGFNIKKNITLLNQNAGALKVLLLKSEIDKESFNFNEHLKNKKIYEFHKRRILELNPKFIHDIDKLNLIIASTLYAVGHSEKDTLKIMYAGKAENSELAVANVFETNENRTRYKAMLDLIKNWKHGENRLQKVSNDNDFIKFKPKTENSLTKPQETEKIYEYQQQQNY